MARDLVHHPLYAGFYGLRFRTELEQGRVRQWAKADHAALCEGPDMPIPAVKTHHFNVRHQHRLLVDRLAFEPQAERFSHRAVAAVGPHQVVCAHYFTVRECGAPLRVHSA